MKHVTKAMKLEMITSVIASILLFLSLSLSLKAEPISLELDQEILSKNVKVVSYDSGVDYKNIKENHLNQLKEYLTAKAAWSQKEYETASSNEKLATLINVYNAATIELVAEHYPIKSIKDIKVNGQGPWDIKLVNLFGKKISLSELENDYIRHFKEPRIHFALVCAAKGCPPLSERSFKAENLKNQLGRAEKNFLLTTHKNNFDKDKNILTISPIFDWYKQDFASGDIKKYLENFFDGVNSKTKIEYSNYDWDLNSQE